MLAFDRQRLTDGLLATVDGARLVLAAAGQQQGVELVQIVHRRHRHEMVPAEEAGFSFDATLLMALTWRTEAGFESPMRAERHEARRLLASKPTQDPLHCRAQVVVPQAVEDATQVLKCQ